MIANVIPLATCPLIVTLGMFACLLRDHCLPPFLMPIKYIRLPNVKLTFYNRRRISNPSSVFKDLRDYPMGMGKSFVQLRVSLTVLIFPMQAGRTRSRFVDVVVDMHRVDGDFRHPPG